MKKSKINNSVIEEAQHRIESLTKGLTKPELKSFKKDLMQLKNKLCSKNKDSLADIYYTSKLQEEISGNVQNVLSNYKNITQTDKNRSLWFIIFIKKRF